MFYDIHNIRCKICDINHIITPISPDTCLKRNFSFVITDEMGLSLMVTGIPGENQYQNPLIKLHDEPF